MSSLVIYNMNTTWKRALVIGSKVCVAWKHKMLHDVTLHNVFGGHQAYIHSKKDWKKDVAWISSDSFESFSPLSKVWIDRPLMPSSDVITTRKPGSDFDWLIV